MKHLQLLNLLTILTGITCTKNALVTANRQSTSTTIATLEIGSGGTVHRSSSSSLTSHYTTLQAVSSFWNALHDLTPTSSTSSKSKKLIPPGLSMVPDLFQKPNHGIFVGLNLVDMTDEELSTMTTLQSILNSNDKINNDNNVVGFLDVKGSHMKQLLNHDDADTSECCVEFGNQLDMSVDQVLTNSNSNGSSNGSETNPMVSLRMSQRTKGSAKEADDHIQRMLQLLLHTTQQQQPQQDSWTVLVHFIIEQTGARTPSLQHHLQPLPPKSSTSSTYSTSRRLEEENYQDNPDDTAQTNSNGGSIYYGYGYYDENGNWYTPYRTINQMQYFQVTLWSALGLLLMVFVSMGKMVNMHLMPDTLLHGESAKTVGH